MSIKRWSIKDAENITLEKLEKICLEVIKEKLDQPKDRQFVLWTGRLGYIQQLEIILGRELTDQEKFDILNGYYKL